MASSIAVSRKWLKDVIKKGGLKPPFFRLLYATGLTDKFKDDQTDRQ